MTSFQSGYVSTPQFSHDGSHMHAGMVSGAPQASAVPQPITAQEAIEVAGRNIEKMIHGDSQFASLADKLRLGKVFLGVMEKGSSKSVSLLNCDYLLYSKFSSC